MVGVGAFGYISRTHPVEDLVSILLLLAMRRPLSVLNKNLVFTKMCWCSVITWGKLAKDWRIKCRGLDKTPREPELKDCLVSQYLVAALYITQWCGGSDACATVGFTHDKSWVTNVVTLTEGPSSQTLLVLILIWGGLIHDFNESSLFGDLLIPETGVGWLPF